MNISPGSVVINQRPAICRVCLQSCGLLVSRTDGRLDISGNPEHPISKGFICYKGKQYGHVHDAPDRLSHAAAEGQVGLEGRDLRRGPWTSCCERFLRSRREYGAQSVCILKGESLKHQEVTGYLHHLAKGFGSPNALSIGSMCQNSLAMAHTLTYGGIPAGRIRAHPAVRLSGGANPANSMECAFAKLKRAPRTGARGRGRRPDPHSAQRPWPTSTCPYIPGTDGYLALAFIKYFAEQVRRGTRIRDSSVGWGPAVRRGGRRVPGTGCSRPRASPRPCSTRRPPSCRTNGPHLVQDGAWAWSSSPRACRPIRAIACLQGLTRSDAAQGPALGAGSSPCPAGTPIPACLPTVGADEYPFFMGQKHEGQAMLLARAILEGKPYPVRTLFVAGSNPMLTFPDPALLGQALRSLDFLAVFDMFMTETARMADLVLPAVTHFEHVELHDYFKSGQSYLGLVRPVDVTGKGLPIGRRGPGPGQAPGAAGTLPPGTTTSRPSPGAWTAAASPTTLCWPAPR